MTGMKNEYNEVSGLYRQTLTKPLPRNLHNLKLNISGRNGNFHNIPY